MDVKVCKLTSSFLSSSMVLEIILVATFLFVSAGNYCNDDSKNKDANRDENNDERKDANNDERKDANRDENENDFVLYKEEN